jgi:NTP pyrophosphatase (non-canonical NTP hydrolase)
MVKEVFEVSQVCKPRNRYQVLSKAMEELGELAQEIGIAEGYQDRAQGKDGIIGECADVINCVLDIVFLTDPTMTEEKFMSIMTPKLAKWKVYATKGTTVVQTKSADKTGRVFTHVDIYENGKKIGSQG